MVRTALSLLCVAAMLTPAVAFAHERDFRGLNRPNNNYYRDTERVRPIDFYSRKRGFDRRNDREWERRRDEERSRYWRDRRDDRFRRDYTRDRDNRPSIIIIPRFSF